jgi:hypothetical protein
MKFSHFAGTSCHRLEYKYQATSLLKALQSTTSQTTHSNIKLPTFQTHQQLHSNTSATPFKMKSTFFSAALISLMAVVTALPAPGSYPDGTVVTVVDPADIPAYIKNPELATRDAAPELQKRANQGVYLCTGAGFTNTCVHIVNGLGQVSK